MNLGNLKTLGRLVVPAAKSARIKDAPLTLIINEVCRDLNARLKLLVTDEKFNVVADQYKYDLSDSSETVARYFKTDKMGLWWNDGTAASPDWKRLLPKTVKWLDKNVSGWRDQDSGDPKYYAKRGKFLTLVPTPDTALTNGLWLNFIENTQDMAKSTDYPFGHETEIPEYAFLTKTILKGIECWIKQPVGKDRESSQAFGEYMLMVEDARGILAESPDIQATKEARIKLKHVC